MKINEFIEELKALQEVSGNVEIYYRTHGTLYSPEFTHIMANANTGEQWVVIE